MEIQYLEWGDGELANHLPGQEMPRGPQNCSREWPWERFWEILRECLREWLRELLGEWFKDRSTRSRSDAFLTNVHIF